LRDAVKSKKNNTVGVILAGGRSQRMGGGHKCLLSLDKSTLLEHVIKRALPQVDRLILNINEDTNLFDAVNLPLVKDSINGFAGPLAGVLAGMEWSLENSPESKWIVTFASDTPFFPVDLVKKFLSVVDKTGAELVCASSKGRSHPVFGLWPVSLWEHLQKAIMKEDMRRIDTWTSRYNLQTVDFVAGDRDPFFNVNRREDLDEARKLLITVS
jgi:molybdopterin-guanine dinucleotide biosynthesis protein A